MFNSNFKNNDKLDKMHAILIELINTENKIFLPEFSLKLKDIN